jgi:probable rRNA maturation factor
VAGRLKVVVAGAAESERRAIRKVLERAAAGERCPKTAVNVIVVSDARIRVLNRRFLARDRATDVMAFPVSTELLGEVYVSRDQARVQARQYGHTLSVELQLLVLHGFLHLSGYSHREMTSRYARYLPGACRSVRKP